MKSIFAAIVSILLAVAAHAQQTKPAPQAGTRIVTKTRLVAVFSDLEQQLLTAGRTNGATVFDRLLARDFQVWTPAPPGQPVPRAAWLEKNASSPPEAFRIRQMAVRSLDHHAVVSFVLVEGGGARQTARFIVDLWSNSSGDWQLTDRYVSSVPPAPYAEDRKPTGKD